MSVLALDLGGSHIGCAVVESGRVLAASGIEIGTNATLLEPLLPEITAQLHRVCRVIGIKPHDCRGLGIGIPSLIDGRTGEMLSVFNKYRDLDTMKLRDWTHRNFGLPIRLENDAALALLGEHFAGAAKGVEDVVLVTLGTGIGVGAMLQNRLLRSHLGHAGALGGHVVVRFDGRRCACGAIGCAEAEASTSVLPEIAASFTGFEQSMLAAESHLDFAAVFRAKDAGDAVAAAILDHCLAVWSALAVTLVHAYGPQLMLFGGGVMRRGEEILGPVRTFVGQHTWKSSRGSAQIEAAALGQKAALIGAEALFEEGHA
jgi:glucokinase